MLLVGATVENSQQRRAPPPSPPPSRPPPPPASVLERGEEEGWHCRHSPPSLDTTTITTSIVTTTNHRLNFLARGCSSGRYKAGPGTESNPLLLSSSRWLQSRLCTRVCSYLSNTHMGTVHGKPRHAGRYSPCLGFRGTIDDNHNRLNAMCVRACGRVRGGCLHLLLDRPLATCNLHNQ